jgi:hypothetical protein
MASSETWEGVIIDDPDGPVKARVIHRPHMQPDAVRVNDQRQLRARFRLEAQVVGRRHRLGNSAPPGWAERV